MATEYQVHGNTFYNEDCISGAKRRLADGSVDLILTDPPYGIDGHKLHKHYNRKESFVVGGYVEVPRSEYAEFSRAWIAEAARVLKPGGQIYVVSGYTNLYQVLGALKAAGLEEINHIIWKYNFGVFTSRKFVSSHYHILYYSKPGGRRTFNPECRFGFNENLSDRGSSNYQDREDVWIINREYKPGQIKNKNELPFALVSKMIQYSSNPGDLVCDFFLGGFSTARVAMGLNRRATGFEVSKKLFDARFSSLTEVQPGDLLDKVRRPVIAPHENQGRPWDPNDVDALIRRFNSLQKTGASKKESVATLVKEFGRGRFSIQKILDKSKDKLEAPRASLRPIEEYG